MPLYKQQQGCAKKPTLVFLHGFLGSSNDWNETIALLKEDFHCIAIDLPGHGGSVAIEGSLTDGFNHFHRLLQNMLNELNVTQYVIVGYSLGGRLALDYARSQSDPRLTALILESSHIGLADQYAKERRLMDDHSWAKTFATEGVIEALSEWYEQEIFSDLSDRKKEMFINKRAHNYGVPLANMLLSTSLGKQIYAMPYLQQTTLPISYCVGAKDKKFRGVADQLCGLKNINVTEFEKAGHNIHQENVQQFAQFIRQQLK
ncbi:putative 2-succinyl-6-hydroxy-2,4-cyclohexadiene-1-carboxylate synthase [Psychromonas marina]|uniref:Putative 2-succinyl-6-hydroxy-2,4-cyclohexadiene-1-carboxylate synthase n=1 Tax=Psychromonas marina TaxID=88364 RepID=A0ABQ6E4R1_9GAMM|nr:2-succinyl-6-hydroxy-2,4-cyclohexadiene-1-carboxylate synthase [Psychromonas marina]GLS92437.1 putative 2-succinyl-6-hydroxy-2,4-cyclohexadiene-1-carboxylate synthase [Psychromonas marina]